MTNSKEKIAGKVLRIIEDEYKDLVNTLRELVQIPSVTGEEKEAQSYVAGQLRNIGLKVDIFEPEVEELKKYPYFFETLSYKKYGYKGRPNVVGLLKGEESGKTLILNGHIDVVPPGPPSDWDRDPWSGVIVENRLYGRGAGDMKGGIAAMLHVIKAILNAEVPLRGNILVETTIEEEDGGIGGALATILRGYKGDAVIIPEPSGTQNIVIGSGGVLYFKVKVRGRPAHAFEAHIGVNAIEKLWIIYEALKVLNEHRQKTISYDLFEKCQPHLKGHVTTLNIGVIHAGDWPSTVPGWGELLCRIGWPPGESIEDIQKQIIKTIEDTIKKDKWLEENPPEIEWLGWKANPSQLSVDDPFVNLFYKITREVVGREVKFCGIPAGMDMRFYIEHGMPAISYGPDAFNIHSPNECVDLNSLLIVSKVIAKVIIEIVT